MKSYKTLSIIYLVLITITIIYNGFIGMFESVGMIASVFMFENLGTIASVFIGVAFVGIVQSRKRKETSITKYNNSTLTPSFSKELATDLLKLLNEDKIFKENNLTLDILAEKLKTTRHNTSQVINEAFKMSFPELMNMYRIFEAAYIIEITEPNHLNIRQISFDVGFNQKSSFNKEFKKHKSQTPSQYAEDVRMLN